MRRRGRRYPIARKAQQSLKQLTRESARRVDFRAWDELGIPSVCLMENAGAGAALALVGRWGPGPLRVVCVCGPGQNGGDGLVVARHLAVAGHAARIVLLPASGAAEPPGDAGVNLRICRAMGLPVATVGSAFSTLDARAALAGCDVVVDALFGTGLARPLDGTAAELVSEINGSGRPVLALDLPSGLDCDTGEPLGPCVRADATATFVAPKAGFANAASRAWTGDVSVVPIGVPESLADPRT